MGDLLTIAEAAKRMGVSDETLRKHIRWGTLSALDVSTPGATRPAYRIDPTEFETWRKMRERPAARTTGARGNGHDPD